MIHRYEEKNLLSTEKYVPEKIKNKSYHSLTSFLLCHKSRKISGEPPHNPAVLTGLSQYFANLKKFLKKIDDSQIRRKNFYYRSTNSVPEKIKNKSHHSLASVNNIHRYA